MLGIIRFRDLEPTWTTRRARELGFMRWLVTWVGGPDGCVNTNPAAAIRSTECAVGLMVLPAGQRQPGRHVHRVTEIYVVLQGTLEGLDGSAVTHRAGPNDCTYAPPGCPHGVRNCGTDDVVLVWVHDGIERNDAAAYYPDDHEFGAAPPMQLVRFADLQPDWSAPGAREAGSMRWSAEWVRGPAAAAGGGAVRNGRVAVGTTIVEVGHRIPPVMNEATRFNLVVEGEATLDGGGGVVEVFGRFDGLQVPAGETAALRNNGPGRLRLVHVDCPRG